MALLLKTPFGTFIFKGVDHKQTLLGLANTMSTLLYCNMKLRGISSSSEVASSIYHALVSVMHLLKTQILEYP